MAAEFSQGLMAGFQVFEGIADRRDRRRLQEERIGLARAAETRAQSAFDQQQNLISEQHDLDRSGRESNEILARAERVGFENLQPHEIAELEDSAQYNPAIAGRLREFRTGQQIDTEVAHLAERGAQRTLGSVALPPTAPAEVTTQPTGTAMPTPEGELTPFDVQAAVGPLGEAELPAAAQQPRQIFVHELQKILPGLEVPEELIERPDLGADMDASFMPGHVKLPADIIQQINTAQETTNVVEKERLLRGVRQQLGDMSGEVTRAKLEAEEARGTVDRWRGFLNPEDEVGSTLRTQASQDPVSTAMELYKSYNTLKKTDPNTLAAVIPQMTETVGRAVNITGNRVADLPRNERGNVAMNEDTRKALADWNASLDLMTNMSDSFDEVAEANIRAGVMPVGNPALTEELSHALANTAPPGKPMSDAQMKMTSTMARRAIQGVYEGGRNITTRQVQAIGRLVRHGVLPPSVLASALEGNPDAAAIEFMELKDGTLIRHDDAGNYEIAYQPAGARGKDDWPAEQLKFARSMYFDTLPPNAKAWQREEAQQKFNKLVVGLTDSKVREALHLSGFTTEDINNLTPQQLTVIGMRQDMIEPTARNMYANQWHWGFNWIHRMTPLGKDPNEFMQELTIASSELDQYARSHTDVRLPTLGDIRELSQSEADAMRMRMVAAGDPVQQLVGALGSKVALENEIRREVAERGPLE